jgi:4-hydroxy-3-methylbut-2-enyl diphosphate reductase
MLGKISLTDFEHHFQGKISPNFNAEQDLLRVGVVNQTTMLASETQEIADFFKAIMQEKFGENFKDHFADTRDTLCYATNDNQQSTIAATEVQADLALVIGGYNSSNTSQIATILGRHFPTYFIKDATEIESQQVIHHFNYDQQMRLQTRDWLPSKTNLRIILTSGASCPDTVLGEVILRIASWFPQAMAPSDALTSFMPGKA